MSKNLPSNLKNSTAGQVAMRDVFPLVSKGQNELMIKPPSDVITAYKDLETEKNQSLLNHSGHLVVAFAAFILLGFGIFMGSRFSNSRDVASSSGFKGFASDRAPSHVEHYQYDKSCYKGDNGEQVCMTRTSRK